MRLFGNRAQKFLVPGTLLIVSVILIKSCSWSGGSEKQVDVDKKDPTRTLTHEEREALGIHGDSPQDTVATLVGRMQTWDKQRQEDKIHMDALSEENKRLAAKASDVEGTVRAALQQARKQDDESREQNEKSLWSQIDQRIGQLMPNIKQGASDGKNVPIGYGLESSDQPRSDAGDSDFSWIEPMDVTSEPSAKPAPGTVATSFGNEIGSAISKSSDAVESRVSGKPDKSKSKPVYTIPENSTLMGSLSMTALLGRIPVDGTVNDPYPFKIVIGTDNLTANGIELPEVQSAVVSGTATGDWTLQCVRGNVTSMTFVFEDGTVRTVPSPADINQHDSGGSNRNAQDQQLGGGSNSIGWISDERGIPCITGFRRSNAQQYLTNQSLLTAAGAGAATLLTKDNHSSVTSFGAEGAVKAMSGSQAMDQILTKGVNDMSQWVNRLYGEAFAAIYVPPGQNVAIHVTKQLPIDYETEGRKVRYDSPNASTHALD